MNLVKRILSGWLESARAIEIIGLRARPRYAGERERFSYQSKHYDFCISPGERVLDVGCGAYPFPCATVLVDLSTSTSRHRSEALKTAGKPFVVADLRRLPFTDKSCDFVYCSHVLEHVDDPAASCEELMRVGKRGYLETPSLMTDALFSWAEGMHAWHTAIIADRIVFFEYDERLVQGVRNPYWRNALTSKRRHPLQDLFYGNLELFNNSLLWRERFNYSVFHLDGRMKHSGLAVDRRPPAEHESLP